MYSRRSKRHSLGDDGDGGGFSGCGSGFIGKELRELCQVEFGEVHRPIGTLVWGARVSVGIEEGPTILAGLVDAFLFVFIFCEISIEIYGELQGFPFL